MHKYKHMFVIGIAGGSGSGKSTFVRNLVNTLGPNAVSLLMQDAYYRHNPQMPEEKRKQMNFDHPDAIEWELLEQHIRDLQAGRSVEQPVYSMLNCLRSNETVTVHPNKVLIVEGILVLTQPRIRDLMSLKIFIDADADHRFMRVVKRDMEERGRTIEQVMHRYLKTVRPMHEEFIEPSKRFADIIVPIGGDNHVAIEVLSGYIRARS